MPTLTQAASVLKAAHHFHRDFILIQHHLERLVNIHVLHIRSALAIPIVAVRKQVVCASGGREGMTIIRETDAQSHRGRHIHTLFLERENGGETGVDNRVFEDASA